MDKAISFVNTILVIADPAVGDHNQSKTYINYVHGVTASVTNGTFFHLPEVSIPFGLHLILNTDVTECCRPTTVPKPAILACSNCGLLPFG